MWVVQTGRGKSAYKNRYILTEETEALFWYSGLNIWNGYKKRLISPDGKIVRRYIS